MSQAAASRASAVRPAAGGAWIAARADRGAGLVLACAAGAVSAAALPPLYLLPLLLVALPVLVLLVAGAAGSWRAALLGFAFGLGHHLVGLYWIAHSLLIDPWRHGWLIPVFVGGLAAILGLFIALAALAARWTAGRCVAALVPALAGWWTVGEWLRSWIFSGFPWNLMGSVWLLSTPMIQLAALTGTWGLSAVTLLAAASPAPLLASDPAAGRRRLAAPALAVALLALVYAGGLVRLGGADSGMVAGVRLRLVQPAIAQTLKWDAQLLDSHVLKQMRMSLEDSGEPPTAVIWAETAVPYSLELNPGLAQALAQVVPPGGLLITGIPRVSHAGEENETWWNSLLVLDGAAQVRATFDKFHLVPFGEYVPVRWIPGADRIAPGAKDFAAGPGPRTLDLPGLPPVGPLICYEVIFPGHVTEPGHRPAWLLNVTNDAWFGRSTGPYQHFAAARMRAVEEGLPLVRVANTGISGVIDGYGRVVARLGLDREGVLDTGLPNALAPTPYARLGNIPAAILVVSVLGLAVWWRRR
jgi:apolipoprotein N-acyltransferase